MERDSVKAFFCLHGLHQGSISSRFGRAVVHDPPPSKERVAHKTARNGAQGCTLKNNLHFRLKLRDQQTANWIDKTCVMRESEFFM